MRHIVFATSFILILATAAQAGERRWDGFYFGGNLGYGQAHATADFAIGGIPAVNASENLGGTVYGAQLGYNYQWGPAVVGIETDIQGTSQKANTTRQCTALACGVALTQTSDDSLLWFGTTRLRAGGSFGRVFLYGTGGAGYGAFKSTNTFTTLLASVTNTSAEQRLAWVAGGGIEAAIDARWSVKAEYLYVDSGHSTTTYSLAGVGVITEETRMTDNIVRLGVNYRF
jgi:outer membrane immunogenic protein